MSIAGSLDRINWDFPSTGTDARSVHATHWFPGNFIPQIPAAFIQVLSRPGELILDPFGGSGTTAIEALRLGRRAILSDRVSACLLIGRGKVSIQIAALDRHAKDEVLAALTWRHQCHTEAFGSNGEGSDSSLTSWFAPGTLSQLRYLWLLIERPSDLPLRRILTMFFSDVLFACASPGQALTATGRRRRHHWGWVADNVHPKKLVEHDAIGLFETRLAALPECIPSADTADVLLIQQDARCMALPSNCVDLVVTSPPYISVIDYTLANRLLYAWMGRPLAREREREIGARFKRRRLRAVGEYLDDMRACWREIHRVLRPNGYCAVVIGESRRYPGTVAETLRHLTGFMPQIWGPVARDPSRRRVSDRGANEPVEYLCVFQKA